MKKATTLHKIPFLILAFIISIIFITGCAAPSPKHMYSGPKLPKSQVATIKSSFRQDVYGEKKETFVMEVDDNRVVIKIKSTFAGFPTEVYILPGKHDLILARYHGTLLASQLVWIVAEPGKTYVAKSTDKGYRVNFFLVDEETGLKVGGIKGSSDEPASIEINKKVD